jgi:hypothetical protein
MSQKDHYPDDDAYVRDEGVLVPRSGGHDVGCDEEQGWCAPDDVVEDPVNDEHVPGTADDLPYDYGVELAPAADQQLLSIDGGPLSGFGDPGLTESEEDTGFGDEPPLGAVDERELWGHQRALIDEAGDESHRYRGLDESSVRAVEESVGEDAGEVLPESPEGTSATGSVGGSD